MAKTKKCCGSEVCEHELTINYDPVTGWIVSTNSYFFKQNIIKQIPKQHNSGIELNDSDYLYYKTTDPTIIRNIISELEA